LTGVTVTVLHYRPRGLQPTVMVELPDGRATPIPIDWTDRAPPNAHEAAAAPGTRLSGLALLEVAERIAQFRQGG
jgi:hypothetical protein